MESSGGQSETGVLREPTVLIILDGFGLAEANRPGNAITPETAPHIFEYMRSYPSTQITAHGEDVGLAANQQGNSEAGHFNIGAGRVVEQDLQRIWRAVADGRFFKNEAFKQALLHVQTHKSAVHIVGLLTADQSAHADPNHLYALLDYFRRNDQKEIYLHLFTDGRDSPPHSAITHLRELRAYMKNGERIATIMGRFYGMDRNKLWHRTEKAYKAMVCGEAPYTAHSAEEAIAQAYNRNETDEYISPTIIFDEDKPRVQIKDHDAICFYNARSDRARQLTKTFVQPDFIEKNKGAFERPCFPEDTKFVAMTDFGPDLPGVLTAFPSPDVTNCLAKAIGERTQQLFISETEKYAHVTYFLNGGFPKPINGEKRELIHSADKHSYAEHPQMHTEKVVDRVVEVVKDGEFGFITVNIPNADMVGHTGNFEAAKVAVKVVDDAVKKIVDVVLAKGGQVLVTADHGNAESMIHPDTHEMMTEHTTNPVPCILIRDGDSAMMMRSGGRLADVAPTVLKMMGIEKPAEMTGEALF